MYQCTVCGSRVVRPAMCTRAFGTVTSSSSSSSFRVVVANSVGLTHSGQQNTRSYYGSEFVPPPFSTHMDDVHMCTHTHTFKHIKPCVLLCNTHTHKPIFTTVSTLSLLLTACAQRNNIILYISLRRLRVREPAERTRARAIRPRDVGVRRPHCRHQSLLSAGARGLVVFLRVRCTRSLSRPSVGKLATRVARIVVHSPIFLY